MDEVYQETQPRRATLKEVYFVDYATLNRYVVQAREERWYALEVQRFSIKPYSLRAMFVKYD